MPRPCHALTMPFFSRPRHSTAVERRPMDYSPVFGFFRLPRGVPRRLLSDAYKSSSQRSIPTTVKSGSNTLQKGRSVKLLDKQFGYFRLQRGLSRRTRHSRSRAGARHGVCELTHGMGTAWARHAMCESASILLRVMRVATLFGLLHPEDVGTAALRNVRYYLLSNTASNHRRPESSKQVQA
jgi:hypothetical protein